MKPIALLLVLPLLAGCDVHGKNPAQGDDKVSINADDNGNISFNLPIAQGQVKVPGGFMHNGNVDIDGVKLMPGSSVTGFNMDSKDHGTIMNIAFTASASADEVRSYYVDQFKKQGAEVAVAGYAVSGKSKEGSPFTIEVTPAASGSQGKIVIEDKD